MATRGDARLTGLSNLLLGGVLVLIAAAVAIGFALYVRPTPRAEMSETEPVVPVVREADLPPGASRVINWGERTVLVVRTGDGRVHAVEGVSPYDGCVLRWDPEATRVVSPCRYQVYDLSGNVVAGLSTAPLRRYRVSLRRGWVYVSDM